MAARADMGICLARTNPDVPKHRGITYFLVDMKSAGIEVRPLREITGAALFNEVFFDGCFVPDDCVVGEIDGGWRLARTTLANERVSLSSDTAFGGALEGVLAGLAGHPERQDPVTLDRLGHLLAEAQSLAQLGVRATLRSLGGLQPGSESSLRKLLGAEFEQRVHEFGLDICGPDGAVTEGEAGRVGPRGPAEQVPDHRRWHQRGAAQRDRRAAARTPPRSGAGPVIVAVLGSPVVRVVAPVGGPQSVERTDGGRSDG